MYNNGIDVSKHQGIIDWKKVKESGKVDFVMIRTSYGTKYIDAQLANNVKGCTDNNIPYGFYHFIYAMTPAEAKAEAEHFLNVIKDYSPTYPIVMDLEYTSDNSRLVGHKELFTSIINTFGEVCEKAKYYTMLYSNVDWLYNYLDREAMRKYDLWLAHWTKNPKQEGQGIWQYGTTTVDGINGEVDGDISYKDYPAIIKKAKLNGFGKLSELETLKAENTELKGKIASQSERINQLESVISNIKKEIEVL
jgi:lysozyme